MARSSAAVALSVWKALILREALSRLFARRAAWFWLLMEPVFHVFFLVLLFSTIRVRHIGGIDTRVWIMVGLCAFFVFVRTGRQGLGAVGANTALFAYRQVLPVDTLIARAVLEGAVMVVATGLMFAGAWMIGLDVIPADPLAVIVALFGLWMAGMGFGMMGSVAQELTPEVGKLVTMLLRPLYIGSGVVVPLASLPQALHGWLMWNPIAHGLEAARLGFAPHYHAVPGVSVAYLYLVAAGMLFVGFLLQVGFAKRMVMQ